MRGASQQRERSQHLSASPPAVGGTSWERSPTSSPSLQKSWQAIARPPEESPCPKGGPSPHAAQGRTREGSARIGSFLRKLHASPGPSSRDRHGARHASTRYPFAGRPTNGRRLRQRRRRAAQQQRRRHRERHGSAQQPPPKVVAGPWDNGAAGLGPSPGRGSPRRTRSLCTAGPRPSLGRGTHRLGPPTLLSRPGPR